MDNPLIAVMKKYKVPMTRAEFLKLKFAGKQPQVGPEDEVDTPDDPRFKPFRETTHEEEAAEEAEKTKEK